MRKLRVQLKEVESDRDRLQRRSAQQDEIMSAGQDKMEKKLAESLKQVKCSTHTLCQFQVWPGR